MKDYPCRFGEGCKKKATCLYVHPSESNYQQSVQRKESQDSRHGGPSPERNKRLANATASNTTALPDGVSRWGKNTGGARKSSAIENNASSSWNFSGQSTTNGHLDATQTTGTNGGFENPAWGSTDNNTSSSNETGWGTGGADSTWANGDATLGWDETTTPRNGGGWGTDNSAGHADGGGWGAGNSGSNNEGGWGAGKSGGHRDDGGFKTGGSGGHKDDGGWGSTNASIAKTSDEAKSHNKDAGSSKGWDQSTTSSFGSWGSLEEKSGDPQKDKGAGKMSDDIQMGDPLPQRKQDEPNPKSAQSTPRSPSKHPAQTLAQTPLSPTFVTPSAVSTKFPPDLKSLALEIAKPKTVPMNIKGKEGRRALYQNIIQHTKNAIIAYIELREAQTDLNRWKDTQMSTIYGHATQETRKILDSERATFHRRLQDVEDTFQKEINALVNLPEMSTTGNKRKPKLLTKEVIAEYTQELQDWFKDLELHKRLLMERESEEGELVEEKEDGEVNDSDEEDVSGRISELLRSGKWTWKKLTEVIEAMQIRYDTIQTSIYFDIFTCIDEDSKARLRLANASFESSEREETQDNDLSVVTERVATTGKNLERQSEELARLLSEAAALEKEVEGVRVQTAQANLVCQLAGRLFGDFEQWKEDDNAQLTAITEQVKHLHLYQPTAASTSGSRNASIVTAPAPPHPSDSSVSALEPIYPSDLIDPIRRLVIGAIHQELNLCFDNLRFRCMENQQHLESEMEEEAKRIMFKAETVKNRLIPSREPSIMPRSQSNIPLVAPH